MSQFFGGYARVSYVAKSGIETVVAHRIEPDIAYTYPSESGTGSKRKIFVWLPGCNTPFKVDEQGRVFASVGGRYCYHGRIKNPFERNAKGSERKAA